MNCPCPEIRAGTWLFFAALFAVYGEGVVPQAGFLQGPCGTRVERDGGNAHAGEIVLEHLEVLGDIAQCINVIDTGL